MSLGRWYMMPQNMCSLQWLCGAMDNASDYESGDCRFDPCQSRKILFWFIFWQLHYSECHFNNLFISLKSQPFNIYEISQLNVKQLRFNDATYCKHLDWRECIFEISFSFTIHLQLICNSIHNEQLMEIACLPRNLQ